MGTVFATVVAGEKTLAVTLTETTDAGETLNTAAAVNTYPPGTALTTIEGSITSSNADLFRIFLTGSQTFWATTAGGSTNFDTQLFLFDANGLGVEANDDTSDSDLHSTLPLGFAPTTPSIYYLGISGYNYDPVSAGGLIFPDTDTAVSQPTGTGGGLPLSGFANQDNNFPVDSGTYTMTLTGAQFVDATPVPFKFSPTLGVVLVGAINAVAQLRCSSRVRRKG